MTVLNNVKEEGNTNLKRLSVHDPVTELSQDILGRRVLANTIFARLTSSDCPFVLGLYGGWGTGKTSLLNLLEIINKEEVTQNNNHKLTIIKVDAWKYESTNSLLMPVVVKLKQKIKDDDFLPEAWKAVTRRILATTAFSIGDIALAKLGIDSDKIQSTYKSISQRESRDEATVFLRWETMIDETEATINAFEKIIKLVISERKTDRILIVVDNLDRCSPESVVSFLESVKNFLSVPQCTWLLAVDSEVIASYISRKYDGTAIDGYSYLDKIVPEQYHLSLSPTEDGDKIIRLIREATNGSYSFDNAEQLPQIPKALTPRRLIKSAKKLSDVQNNAVVQDSIIFAMILLYHTWPDFYERLSSPSTEHISGILAHFFKDKNKGKWEDIFPAPFDEKFTEDPELTYFLRHTFPAYKTSQQGVLWDIKNTCDSLRSIGLP